MMLRETWGIWEVSRVGAGRLSPFATALQRHSLPEFLLIFQKFHSSSVKGTPMQSSETSNL